MNILSLYILLKNLYITPRELQRFFELLQKLEEALVLGFVSDAAHIAIMMGVGKHFRHEDGRLEWPSPAMCLVNELFIQLLESHGMRSALLGYFIREAEYQGPGKILVGGKDRDMVEFLSPGDPDPRYFP